MDPGKLRAVGEYRVIRLLGEGGTAWVFEVQDPAFADRRLALKLLKPEVASTPLHERLQREAELLARITHPSLLTVFGHGRDPATGLFFYVMTRVDGGDLRRHVAERGPLDPDELGQVYLPVLGALSALHEATPPIIHRDVKPGNILLDSRGHPYLSDLGIAREQGSAGTTHTGFQPGTALYMSPEQARAKRLDVRSDVFSMGLSIYHSLTGATVYDRLGDVDTGSQTDVLAYLVHLARSSRDLRIELPRSVPASVRAVVQRATRIHAEERYPNAGAMRSALLEALRTRGSSGAARWPRNLSRSLLAGLRRWSPRAPIPPVAATPPEPEPTRILQSPGSEPESAAPSEPPSWRRRAVVTALPLALAASVGGSVLWLSRLTLPDPPSRPTPPEGSQPDPALSQSPLVPDPGVPLQLIAREPEAERVTVYRGEPALFAVEVHDAAPLRYAWTVGETARPETGPELRLEPQRTTRVAVEIARARPSAVSAPLRVSWDVALGNRPPRLRVAPEPGPGRQLRVGERVRIRALTSDPDGDALRVEIRGADQRVQGDALEFEATSPGRFTFRVRVSDGRERTEHFIQIEVRPPETEATPQNPGEVRRTPAPPGNASPPRPGATPGPAAPRRRDSPRARPRPGS